MVNDSALTLHNPLFHFFRLQNLIHEFLITHKYVGTVKYTPIFYLDVLKVGCVVIAAAIDCKFVLGITLNDFQRQPILKCRKKYIKKENMSNDNLTAVLYGIEDIRLVRQN